jgi:hypothetical protein
MSASRQPGIRAILLENRELVAKREDLRLQGGTGSKTGGNQSEKGNEKRANRDRTRISRMIGTSAFSARTEFSVTTGFPMMVLALGYLPLDAQGRSWASCLSICWCYCWAVCL